MDNHINDEALLAGMPETYRIYTLKQHQLICGRYELSARGLAPEDILQELAIVFWTVSKKKQDLDSPEAMSYYKTCIKNRVLQLMQKNPRHITDICRAPALKIWMTFY